MTSGRCPLRAANLAAGLISAVIKDSVPERVAQLEYLETVAKARGLAGFVPRLPRGSGVKPLASEP